MFVVILHWLWMLTLREGNLLRGQQRLVALFFVVCIQFCVLQQCCCAVDLSTAKGRCVFTDSSSLRVATAVCRPHLL
jgi:hypothetical protein